MATVKELRAGLASTTMPQEFADAMLKTASALWLSSDNAQQLSGDLAMCYPALKRAEVRARAVAQDGEWRLTVVAHDRKGLLADTAAILSLDGFSIRSASVATWDDLDLALFAITVDGEEPGTERLNSIGESLKAAGKGNRPSVPFAPIGRAYVRRTGVANGDDMISVVAPDQAGLLATVCGWFSAEGVSIEAAWITGEHDEANDVFVVDGEVDCAKLERELTLEDHSIEAVVGSMFEDARRAGETLVRNAVTFLNRALGQK
jgi:UTP:GlnB (protein PII) uridylyltransferase